MTARLLKALNTPRTLDQLAAELGVSPEAVALMLRQLEARGYVGPAYDQSPACGTACSACSLKRLCPAAGQATPSLRAWRLTEKGEAALKLGP